MVHAADPWPSRCDLEQCLLQEVFGLVQVAHHQVRGPQQAIAVVRRRSDRSRQDPSPLKGSQHPQRLRTSSKTVESAVPIDAPMARLRPSALCHDLDAWAARTASLFDERSSQARTCRSGCRALLLSDIRTHAGARAHGYRVSTNAGLDLRVTTHLVVAMSRDALTRLRWALGRATSQASAARSAHVGFVARSQRGRRLVCRD